MSEPSYPPGTKYAVGALVEVTRGHRRGQWVRVYDVKGNLLHVREWTSKDRREAFWISDRKVAWPDPDEVIRWVSNRVRGMNVTYAPHQAVMDVNAAIVRKRPELANWED